MDPKLGSRRLRGFDDNHDVKSCLKKRTQIEIVNSRGRGLIGFYLLNRVYILFL